MEIEKINLLVFSRDFPKGMAGTKRIQHLLYYLLSQKININVISFRSKTPQPVEKGDDNGIPFVNIGIQLDFKVRELHRIIGYYAMGFHLILKNKKHNNKNIVYCYGAINIENLLFVIWAKLLRYRIIFDLCEDYSFFEDQVKTISRFKFWTVNRFDFLTYRWSAALVVISTHLMNKYINRGKKEIVLIPVTARQNFNAGKKKFNNPLQVVYAGSFDNKDGVNDIIEGFTSFNTKHKDAMLILTGKSDRQLIYKDKYESYTNIIFKGYLQDEAFYDLLKNSDVLCMCRTNSGFANAGFPFKLGEYLATGNPVISTKASDVEKYLTNDDVYLIEPNSPEQISKALEEIFNDPEKARKTGLNGMKKCQKFFSPENNGRLLHDLLIKIASE